MLAASDCCRTTVLLVLVHLSFSAMVLPRPPSSRNYIQQDQGLSNRKVYQGKSLQGFLQNSNIKRPDINDYRVMATNGLRIRVQGGIVYKNHPVDIAEQKKSFILLDCEIGAINRTRKRIKRKTWESLKSMGLLFWACYSDEHKFTFLEIELQSPDEIDASNLQSIVHSMLKRPDQIRNESYPNPEVISHSVFGVRDFGLRPNIKLKPFDEEEHALVEPPKLQNLDEKLYYLKNSRPKVYVNVRGHSGSFRKDLTLKTTSSNDPVGFLRVTPYLQKQTEWKAQHSKKIRPPKKFDRQIDSNGRSPRTILRNQVKKLSRLASVYGLDDLSTTENSMVTSSELPKQIPAPPSKLSSRSLMVQTTPVQRYALGRMDILPGYSLSDA